MSYAVRVDGLGSRMVASEEDLLPGEVLANVAPPSPTATQVPRSVPMRQARLALLNNGMLPTVNAAIAAMTGSAGEAARIEWEYSQEVQRNKALVQQLAPVLGLNDAQLDALFMYAATL